MTQKKKALVKDVKNGARIPSDICWQLLEKMQNEELVYLNGDEIEVNEQNRIKIAVKAAAFRRRPPNNQQPLSLARI